MSNEPENKENAKSVPRPLAVSIVALLVLLAAILALLFGLLIYAQSSYILTNLGSQPAPLLGSVTEDILLNVAYLSIFYGAIHLAIAWGLWTGQNWARVVSIALSLFGILIFINAVLDFPEVALPILIFAGLVIYYFTRPPIKAYFS